MARDPTLRSELADDRAAVELDLLAADPVAGEIEHVEHPAS